MRRVIVSDDFRLGFPGRCEKFLEGVEIGLLIPLMDAKLPVFSSILNNGTVSQAMALADGLGYVAEVEAVDGDWTTMTFRSQETTARTKPKLTLVKD